MAKIPVKVEAVRLTEQNYGLHVEWTGPHGSSLVIPLRSDAQQAQCAATDLYKLFWRAFAEADHGHEVQTPLPGR